MNRPLLAAASASAVAFCVFSLAAPCRAQFGGAGGSAVGGSLERLAEPARPHPLSGPAARTWLALQQPAQLDLPESARLELLLHQVRSALNPPPAEGASQGSLVPVYLDPQGLQNAEKTLESPVTIQLSGVPLASSLRLALDQLGMAYYVQEDGILVLTDAGSRDVPDLAPFFAPVSAAAAHTWIALEQDVSLTNAEETPLEVVLRQLLDQLSTTNNRRLVLFLNPMSLTAAGVEAATPVRVDIDSLPASSALDLVTRQLGLGYIVRPDGVVVIQDKPAR